MDPLKQILADLTISRCSASALAERMTIDEDAITVILRRLEREKIVESAELYGKRLVIWGLTDHSKIKHLPPS